MFVVCSDAHVAEAVHLLALRFLLLARLLLQSAAEFLDLLASDLRCRDYEIVEGLQATSNLLARLPGSQ